jgi:hypothetical protein
MIRLDISTLIFFYVLFSVIVILVVWIVSGYRKLSGPADNIDYTWRCSVCSYAYIDSKHDEISVCPLCGSYNKKEEVLK